MSLSEPCKYTLTSFFVVVVIGECNSTNQTLVHNIQNNTVYQFRVQLSPAHSCHCVNIETVGDIKLLNGGWCNDLQNTTTICAAEGATRTYLSEPVAVISTTNSTTQHVGCDHSFAAHNVMDLAIAYEGDFTSCPGSQCLFPLLPLRSDEKL